VRLRISNCSLLLIDLPRKDERLSRPGWLTYSERFTHISGHPSAAGRAQDRESSPVKDRRSTNCAMQLTYVRYCEEYSYSFRLFFDAWSKNSWNSLFVVKERKFHSPERKFEGTKVLGTFAPEERKFNGSKCSREQKFLESSTGANVPGNKSSTKTKVPSVDFSLPGT